MNWIVLSKQNSIQSRQENKMSRKFTVKFQIELLPGKLPDKFTTPEGIEYDLKDLLETSVLPALGFQFVPLTFEVKKARN